MRFRCRFRGLLCLFLFAGAGACRGADGSARDEVDASGPDDASSDARLHDSDSGVAMADPHAYSEEEQRVARAALEAQSADGFSDGWDPARLYAEFSEFARMHFGAVGQPRVYEHGGADLVFDDAGEWIHASPNALTVGFASNLPARSHVEVVAPDGSTQGSTAEPERYFYQHLHRIGDLTPDTTYRIALVIRDELGRVVRTPPREVVTAAEGAIEIPGALAGPPYVLEGPGEYVVTEDIVADGTALVVAADGVTLDLNGHEVTYSAAARDVIRGDSPETAQSGVYARGVSGLTIVGGVLSEGYVGNASSAGDRGLHAISVASSTDTEIGGVTLRYHGAQVFAVYLPGQSGRMRAHHSEWIDGGWEILDRHGAGGSRCLYLPNTDGPNDFVIDHNLVKRARHTAFNNADVIIDNEVYIDSWATNGFALSPHSKPGVDGGRLERNEVFLTGYHAIGFGWAHQGLVIRDNLVHLESIETGMRRWWESYGDHDSLNGFRITNYGSGGQVRDGLSYQDNLVLGRGRSGGLLRGTAFFTDRTITDVSFARTTIELVAADDETLDIAPIVTQGVTRERRAAEPLYYRDLHLVSDVANVRFGDSYGKGDAHRLERCVFERVGDRPSYHTFVFDGTYDSRGHVVLDPTFVGGAAYDDVWWRETSAVSAYSIAYTLTVEGPAGRAFEIRDVDGALVHSGSLDEAGEARIPLSATTLHPVGWPDSMGRVSAPFERIEERHTPHTLIADDASTSVTMDRPQSVALP